MKAALLGEGKKKKEKQHKITWELSGSLLTVLCTEGAEHMDKS